MARKLFLAADKELVLSAHRKRVIDSSKVCDVFLKVYDGALRVRLDRGGRRGGIALDRGLWIGAHAHVGLAGSQRGGAQRQQTGKDKCGARLRFHGY